MSFQQPDRSSRRKTSGWAHAGTTKLQSNWRKPTAESSASRKPIVDAPWLNFEGGVISKLGRSVVIPFLFDLPVSKLSSRPLTQFQAVRNNRDDITCDVEEHQPPARTLRSIDSRKA